MKRTRRQREPEHKGNSAVIDDLSVDETDVSTLQEVAELIETEVDDLCWLPFSVSGVMYMSRESQLDDDAGLNRNAMMIAKKMMHDEVKGLGISGKVVIFRESPPWGPLEGDDRHKPAESDVEA